MATKASEPLVHLMVRTVHQHPMPDVEASVSGEELDALMSDWKANGYRIAHVNSFLTRKGEHQHEVYDVLVVFEKE